MMQPDEQGRGAQWGMKGGVGAKWVEGRQKKPLLLLWSCVAQKRVDCLCVCVCVWSLAAIIWP